MHWAIVVEGFGPAPPRVRRRAWRGGALVASIEVPTLIVCDFDGTITRRDTLHVIVERYGMPGVWDAIEPRLRSGEVTLEQAMEEQFAGVRATPDEIRRLVAERAELRAGFHELVDWSRARGRRLVVLSSGFRSVIEDVLGRVGLGHLPVEAHDARFAAEGSTILWSERGGEECDRCGRRCKRHDLEHHRRAGEAVVYVGDGVSDRCAAQDADLVFARDGLAEFLDGLGIPFRPFEDFHDVRVDLDRRPPVVGA